ncbi:hypothetical protein EST38_g1263 [Candolleomyces aberdarensis]|uniref:TRUD domain-containing protein n=1 Tax=Candolleomyces aberdarensis TaxID=2316362 RepID=A0A4Q2DWA5_9AGAR|nr:hypothetical protein EST38_g1263 [Candolleomyces aberdarensis]
MSAPIILRERDQDDGDAERYAKRFKTDNTVESEPVVQEEGQSQPAWDHVLPPSHSLLGVPLPEVKPNAAVKFLETDVGISEYIGRGEAKIEGIIKQRFTDFLVFEVDQDSNVIHIKTLEKPQSSKNAPEEPNAEGSGDAKPDAEDTVAPASTPREDTVPSSSIDAAASVEPPTSEETASEPWPENFNTTLAPFLSPSTIEDLKKMLLEGPEPPLVSDSGWAGRAAKAAEGSEENTTAPAAEEPPSNNDSRSRGGRGGRGRGRDNRGGRGGGRGGRGGPSREDPRKVISESIDSKDVRTAMHKTIRELFKGKFDTQANDDSQIVIKWARDLTVAGTKDKRGVTTQRVSLRRNNKTVEDVWKLANGIGPQRSPQDALSQRGERGIRISDLVYRKAGLELGMLKGNAFVITLRNVKAESTEVLDEAMNTIKSKGFINYYGMQRFGTASVPTHAIGLALLKSDWNKAIDLILQKRYGEHPDVAAARDAWLEEKDLDKALRLLPRRVVAERCILESFKKMKGDTRNAMGALSTIPRNLRLMYIHAYQSYVWNAIVSERIKTFGTDKPVVGDLVFDKEVQKTDKMDVDGEEEEGSNPQRNRKPYSPPRIKTLTEEDLDKYSIFDVVMPLPGTDVAYPGGVLGERYRQFLVMDGLDPDNFVRKQKEYTLNGSYRAILHLPKELSWGIMRYTDPDVSLAQSDEDRLLGFDPPAVSDEGKFMALQIRLTLGTAAYATMALREITKTDTSTHIQTGLTQMSEDQKFRGTEAEAIATEVTIPDSDEILED